MMLAFVATKGRFTVHLRPEDVHAALGGTADLAAVAEALVALEGWSNCGRIPTPAASPPSRTPIRRPRCGRDGRFAMAAAAVVAAARRWYRRADLAPQDLANLKWQQAKAAVGAGAGAWRDTERLPTRREGCEARRREGRTARWKRPWIAPARALAVVFAGPVGCARTMRGAQYEPVRGIRDFRSHCGRCGACWPD